MLVRFQQLLHYISVIVNVIPGRWDNIDYACCTLATFSLKQLRQSLPNQAKVCLVHSQMITEISENKHFVILEYNCVTSTIVLQENWFHYAPDLIIVF